MKRNIFSKALAVLFAATAFNACSLDEYNPAAGSGGDETRDFTKWSGMVTYCYEPLYGQLFSAFDYFAVAEGGTDLWLTSRNQTWGQQVFYYEGLTTNTNYTDKLFTQAYSLINTCNTVLEVAPEVVGGDENAIRVLQGEALCLRAYYYYILVSNYGNVTLKLTSSQDGADLSPERNTYEELYGQMVADLKQAAEYLNVEPYNGDYARCTKKTALGLLARVYAQGAGEGLTEDGVSYWQRAKEVAEDLIANAASYGAALYDDVADVWASANNKNNAEALFIASAPSTSVPTSANYAQSNIFSYMYPNPYNLDDLYVTRDNGNYFLGRVNNNILAPSKYLIDLFDADYDKRWEVTFMTAYGNTTLKQTSWYPNDYEDKTITLTAELCTKYGIDQHHVGKKIYPYADGNMTSGTWNQWPHKVWPRGDHSGDISVLVEADKNIYYNPYPLDVDEDRFVIYLSKDPMTAEEKAERAYLVINIDDLFDDEGKYVETPFDANQTNAYQLYPGLNKLNWCFDGAYTSNLQRKVGDTFIMRMAEVYLIAAEANAMLGDETRAATYLNPLRQRACRNAADYEAHMRLTTADEQTVLDEYARELCGEFNRWALLKRHHAFESQLAKGNPRAARSFTSVNYLRPISYSFLNQIENAAEYGTNGY